LGIAVYPEHGSTQESILRAADDALYRAKQAGRDRVVLAERENK
jgi:diguanylate cyclase (GGDEF)-like protein